MNNPLVSVLMPVYNAEKYVEEAIQSILIQTHSHFQFLIIDDGSTDSSLSAIKKQQDVRIELISFEQNKGLVSALNTGIKKAKGKYILRMDADDIALPTRIEKQVAYMEMHPECILSGTAFESFNEEKRKVVRYPKDDMEIRFRFLYQCPFAHPTVIMRSEQVHTKKLFFSSNFQDCEDLELWIRMADYGKLANLSEVLLKYRVHGSSLSQAYSSRRWQQTKEVIINFWNRFDKDIRIEDFETIYSVFYKEFKPRESYLYRTKTLLEKLHEGNYKNNYFPPYFLSKKTSEISYHIFYNSGEKVIGEFKLFRKSAYKKIGISKIMWLKLFIKKALRK